MSLHVPTKILAATTSGDLESARKRAGSWRSDETTLTASDLTPAALDDLAISAERAEDKGFLRVVNAIIAARAGHVKKIPSYRAAVEILIQFLRQDVIDGWLYVKGADGHLHPYLVRTIQQREDRAGGNEYVVVELEADMLFGKEVRVTRHLTFAKSDIAGKTPADLLLKADAYKETRELREAYGERLDLLQNTMHGFAKQYRFTGTPLSEGDRYGWRTPNGRMNVKVIHDLAPNEIKPLRVESASIVWGDSDASVGPVPVDTILPVFDLSTHENLTVNAADLTEYEYDKSLGEKLILPRDQRELLNVLTTDLSTFVGDIVEGKTAGNVVLAKGVPGVGKTLTAEVYAEIIQRPLYSIHSGSLGVTAPDVRKNLETVFARAQRWNAVLLLDEADVFVLERGTDLQQNAIVAEFLRTMEYFQGLLFMTTNRANDIDDAILSRCAAIIDYRTPSKEHARAIWLVMADNYGVTLGEPLLDDLLVGFPEITPRDIKMLLRLVLRVAAHRGEEPSLALFEQCAMFRGLHFDGDALWSREDAGVRMAEAR